MLVDRPATSSKEPNMNAIAPAGTAPESAGGRSFLLERVQPALSGLMDGSLSTLAPIFAVALATHRPPTAFFTGAATALGAGVSMAFSEGRSDTGDLTGRGNPVLRGSITGGETFAGGIFHTLPFIIPATAPPSARPSPWSAASCSSWPGCGTGSSTPASPGHSWRSPSAGRSSPP